MNERPDTFALSDNWHLPPSDVVGSGAFRATPRVRTVEESIAKGAVRRQDGHRRRFLTAGVEASCKQGRSAHGQAHLNGTGGPISGVFNGPAAPITITIAFLNGFRNGSASSFQLFVSQMFPDGSIWPPVIRSKESLV